MLFWNDVSDQSSKTENKAVLNQNLEENQAYTFNPVKWASNALVYSGALTGLVNALNYGYLATYVVACSMIVTGLAIDHAEKNDTVPVNNRRPSL